MEPVSITLAVPTFLRPLELSRTLPLLEGQAQRMRELGYTVGVLILDNDPGGSASAVVDQARMESVRRVTVNEPGISAVRNRALAEAGTDLLVFIDDDEQPEPEWLRALVETARVTCATLVVGRVLAGFPPGLDPWLAAGDFWERPRHATGTRLTSAACGSMLLDLSQVEALGVSFSPAFGLSGGEDTLFTRTVVQRGGSIVWCDESVALDPVPTHRATRRWVMIRAVNQGNCTSRVELALVGGRSAKVRARLTFLGFARVAGGAVRAAWGALSSSPRHQGRGLRSMCRGAGMLLGASGFAFLAYARDGRWIVKDAHPRNHDQQERELETAPCLRL